MAYPLRSFRAATAAIVLTTLATTAGPAPAEVQTKDQRACTLAMNKALVKVAGAAGKLLGGCLGSSPGSIESCVAADADATLAIASAKTVDAYADRCIGDGLPPAFGVTSAAAVNGAASAMALDVAHDVFGPDLDAAFAPGAADKALAKCQRALAKALDKCTATTLKQFVKCKQDGLDDTIADLPGLAACADADPKAAIAKQCDLSVEPAPGKPQVDALRKALDKCRAAGVDLGAAFPACAAADREGAHACLDRTATCRTCLALDQADGLDLDCDARDDGLANGSCSAGPLVIGQHQCILDPLASGAFFDTTSFFTFLSFAGGMTFDCGAVDPATHTAPCTCTIDAFDPVRISGLGWACISPAPGCAPGFIDCDGGSAIDLAIAARHNIGTCTGNAGCAAQCAAHCGSAEVYESGCEGFCRGGGNDGLACTGDLLCPGGTCNGPDRVFNGNICECQCLTEGGNPSRPGGLRCNLGVDIVVEASEPCGDGDVILAIGRQCLPFTTESAESTLTDANNVPGQTLPPGQNVGFGLPRACPDFAATGPSGFAMTSAVNFFEAPVARDAAFLFFLGCQ